MKKIICVLLCAVMAFGLFVPSYAAENTVENYNGYPLVVVRGINFMGLYNEDNSPAVSFALSDIFSFAKSYLSDYYIAKNENAFVDNSLKLVEKIFAPVANDKEGNSVNNLVYDKFDSSMADFKDKIDAFPDNGEEGIIKSAVEKIGYENVFYFTYDWRKSAKELAGELKSLIETALASTGKDKVNLMAVSMGGMVTTAYLYYYGSESVNNLLYVSSAHNGTYTCGDCLNGNIYFNANTLYYQTKKLVGGGFIKDLFVDIINKIGVFKAVANAANNVVENNKDILNNDVFRNGFGTILGLWALCPDDIFDSGVEFVFSGHKQEYPELMKKLDETRSFVFATQETIDEAIDDGANVYFLSNYDSPLSPYFKNSNLQSDGVIETKFTSNFANVALYGETFGEEYINSSEKEYISPDGIIDASTAQYKEVTWFIKDAPHVAAIYGSEYAELVFEIVLSEKKLNVNSIEKYPRFMALDKNNQLIAQ